MVKFGKFYIVNVTQFKQTINNIKYNTKQICLLYLNIDLIVVR